MYYIINIKSTNNWSVLMEKHVVAAYKVHRIICKDKCIHINGHKIANVNHGIS